MCGKEARRRGELQKPYGRRLGEGRGNWTVARFGERGEEVHAFLSGKIGGRDDDPYLGPRERPVNLQD